MARVVVCGAMGRMGRAILGILKDRPHGLVLSGALETPGHPLLGQDAFEAAGAGRADVVVTSDFPSAIARADVAIVETHHRFKKDSPSGTAVKLADAVAGALGRDMKEAGVYGRRGMVGERTRKEIGGFAGQAGDVVGEHPLVFGGIGERFEITHRAHSRDTFARGAVRAASWVIGKPPGLYDMRAVLGV